MFHSKKTNALFCNKKKMRRSIQRIRNNFKTHAVDYYWNRKNNTRIEGCARFLMNSIAKKKYWSAHVFSIKARRKTKISNTDRSIIYLYIKQRTEIEKKNHHCSAISKYMCVLLLFFLQSSYIHARNNQDSCILYKLSHFPLIFFNKI